MVKVNPTQCPLVIGSLIDLDCSEDFIKTLLQNVCGLVLVMRDLTEHSGLCAAHYLGWIGLVCISHPGRSLLWLTSFAHARRGRSDGSPCSWNAARHLHSHWPGLRCVSDFDGREFNSMQPDTCHRINILVGLLPSRHGR